MLDTGCSTTEGGGDGETSCEGPTFAETFAEVIVGRPTSDAPDGGEITEGCNDLTSCDDVKD